MLKVTENGIIKTGEVLDLTRDDQLEILKAFVSVGRPVSLAKKNGVWTQIDPSKEYMDA